VFLVQGVAPFLPLCSGHFNLSTQYGMVIRHVHFRVKILSFLRHGGGIIIFTVTLMSPLAPSFTALPCPFNVITSLFSMPGGICKSKVLCLLTTPVPWHTGQTCSGTEPAPWHVGHVVWVMNTPKGVLCLFSTTPVPWHLSQVFVLPSLHLCHDILRRVHHGRNVATLCSLLQRL